MPIPAQCNDCGKKYVVSSTMAGKRAKCKACGNVFRIGPAESSSKRQSKTDGRPKAAVAASPPPPPPPPLIRPTDLGIAGAFARPVAAPLSAAAARLSRRLKVLSWIQLRWWMLGVFLCCSIFIGLSADRWPRVWIDSLFVFPALACVFLLLGIFYASARALLANNDERIVIGDMLLINYQFAMVVLLRLRTLAYRRTILRSDQYQKFYRLILGTILRAICLAGMSVVVLAAKSASKSLPTAENTQRAVQNFFDDSHRHKHRAGGDAESP